jgi:ParB-like chromosome segregation protein Spo0J
MQIYDKRLDEIKPYENNPRHNDNAVDAVANSIREFGFKVPLVVDSDGVIVAGHTRYKAAKKLGLQTVPCLIADDLTKEQVNAFRLADNKVGELATWDLDTLKVELDNIGEIDMSEFGFSLDDFDVNGEDSAENKYTEDIKAPQYEVKGEKPKIKDLVDKTKVLALEEEIKASKIDEQVKEFLLMAAKRHYVFDYAKIAEYYAQASPEVQELMERSALVIIDYDDAILNGYVEFAKNVGEMGDDNAE